jgi:hypothetical protein
MILITYAIGVMAGSVLINYLLMKYTDGDDDT